MSGIQHEIKKGERLPDEVLESGRAVLSDFIIKPDDIADAVLYVLECAGGGGRHGHRGSSQ
jgi:hypothetical protein